MLIKNINLKNSFSILEIHDQNDKIPIPDPPAPPMKSPATTPNYGGEKGPGVQAKATNTSRELNLIIDDSCPNNG